jgi:hypothetical protein
MLGAACHHANPATSTANLPRPLSQSATIRNRLHPLRCDSHGVARARGVGSAASMVIVGYVSGAISLGILLNCLRLLGPFWRGEPSKLDAKLRIASSEGALTRAFIRALPVTAILGTTMCVIALALVIFKPGATAAGYVLLGALFAAALAYIVLASSILLFNRPRFLVPPALRDRPGILDDLNRSAS